MTIDDTGFLRTGGRDPLTQALLDSIYRAAPIGIGIVVNRIFYAANDLLCSMTGYGRHELIGQSARIVYDSDEEYERVGREKYQLIERYGRGSIETRWRCKSGAMLDVLLSSAPISPGNDRAGVTFTVLDITDRKNAERALREANRTFSTLLDNLPGVAYRCLCSRDWPFLFVSAGSEDLTGYTPAELIDGPLRFGRLIRHDFRDRVWELVQSAVSRKQPFEITYPIIDARGVEKWVWERGRGIFSESGELCCLEGFISDINDRHRAERDLAAEKERLAVTLRSIADGVITSDTGGRITSLNRAAEQLIGCRQEEAAGRPLSEVLRLSDAADGSPFDAALDMQQSGGEQAGPGRTLRLSGHGGAQSLVSYKAAPLCVGDGRVIGAVIVLRDVTLERRMQTEMQRSAMLESLGTLAGGIAHDFNNLLGAIAGNAGLALLDIGAADTQGVRRCLNEIEKASMRARGLTVQLLAFSRGGAPVTKPTGLSQVIRDAAGFALAGSHNSCRYELCGDWIVRADPDQIARVIHNLVLNADQAMPPPGEIGVSSENRRIGPGDRLPLSAGAYVVIRVVDQGSGILAQHLPRIFDPFFTTKQHGSGLGLAATLAIVRAHGGHIEAASQPGEGSSFTLYLPALPEHPAEPSLADPQAAPARPLRILVIDDEALVREMLEHSLTSLGHSVFAGGDGPALTKALDEGRCFDLALLDLTIAGSAGGAALLEQLRAKQPDIPAIASSGYTSDPILAQAASYGFDAALPKPYNISDLQRAIREALAAGRKRQNARQPAECCGPGCVAPGDSNGHNRRRLI